FKAEDGIRDRNVTGVQTCALPIWQARYDPQQRVAADRGGPGDVRGAGRRRTAYVRACAGPADGAAVLSLLMGPEIAPVPVITHRSEERRVGKEWRSRVWSCDYTEK